MAKSPPSGRLPGYDVGDEVFFQHESGPNYGRIVSHGEHGCHVDTDGGDRHKVLWGSILGHKERANRKYKVIARGEVGGIIEDENGKRQFVRDLPEPEAEKPDESDEDIKAIEEYAKGKTPMVKSLAFPAGVTVLFHRKG